MTPHDVYATARPGLRTQLASGFSTAARARRYDRLFTLTNLMAGMRVLDVGCGALGLRGSAADLEITGVDLDARPDYPGEFVQADATRHLPFDDGLFDLVYCSSVIEHVAPRDRPAFAAELERVGRGLYVQTPAIRFPVEPHALLPLAHWLPVAARRAYWRFGVAGDWEEIHLLRRGELDRLFAEAQVVPERAGPLTKSWIAVAPIRGG